MTLARRHFLRVTAAAASAAAVDSAPVNASAYELLLMKLAEDRRRLKEIQSIERKVQVKRQLLPDYMPWIEGVLEAGRGGQDAVLMTMMVWSIDTGEHLLALQIAKYALAHNLVMPDQYQRGVATLVAEEISDQALAAIAAGAGYDHTLLELTELLTAEHDMPDQVRAKVHKALGLTYLGLAGTAPFTGAATAHATAALEHMQRAVQLHERCGVKKEIERLERALRHSAPADPSPAADTPAAGDTAESSSNAAELGAPEDTREGESGAPAPATQD